MMGVTHSVGMRQSVFTLLGVFEHNVELDKRFVGESVSVLLRGYLGAC